jgi:hypothetical protein
MSEEQQGKKMEQEGAEAEGVFVVSVWCEGKK